MTINYNNKLVKSFLTPTIFLLAVTVTLSLALGQRSLQRIAKAPGLPNVDHWLNTDQPLTLHQLRGQVVLLDFWTYCCINCMHVFEDLKYLENKYADQPFVVIGVHSGKFDQEKDPQNIQAAIERHELAHPVAVDSDYQIWRAYNVRAWPTLVLIDPQGYVVAHYAGEGHRKKLDQAINTLLKIHRRKGTLAEPLSFQQESPTTKNVSKLSFPGKVLADGKHQRLLISDTNNHRIIQTDLNGKIHDIIGEDSPGLNDGSFAKATFNRPHGLATSPDGRWIYVADTNNHALRAVDLQNKNVKTLAGTGEQARRYNTSGLGNSTPLSSPWDVVLVERKIYIAMAGLHQIWVYDLDTKRVKVFAGTGQESSRDGPARRATFAQPSALVTNGRYLFVADSEASTIRQINLKDGYTTSVAGSNDLFGFGIRDGVGPSARFQHPLGLALHNNFLYVADTYNNAIRHIDLSNRKVTTWLGEQASSLSPADKIDLYEPGGLSITDNTLYIADTNKHRILSVDLSSRQLRVTVR